MAWMHGYVKMRFIERLRTFNKMEQETYVKVDILESEIEAQLLDSILNKRNIPHHIQSYHDTAYAGLFQTQKGWGVLVAPGFNILFSS